MTTPSAGTRRWARRAWADGGMTVVRGTRAPLVSARRSIGTGAASVFTTLPSAMTCISWPSRRRGAGGTRPCVYDELADSYGCAQSGPSPFATHLFPPVVGSAATVSAAAAGRDKHLARGRDDLCVWLDPRHGGVVGVLLADAFGQRCVLRRDQRSRRLLGLRLHHLEPRRALRLRPGRLVNERRTPKEATSYATQA